MIQKFTTLLRSRSIKVNYILNLLRVISAALVGIFTLPYITRVLGAENLGKVEYVNTIINYFVLFSALGIPIYGIREVSKCRQNQRELFKLVAELYTILFITTIISYLILFGVLMQLHLFSDYHSLLVIMSSMILLSNMGAEWYFQGTENQLYITMRYVMMRLIIFGLFFLLIKFPSDYMVYAILLVILNFGANLLNFILIAGKIANEKIKLTDLEIKKHLTPIATIFIATISVNIYLQLDNFLIGLISGDKYVGYYMIANKLIRYIISFITIIGAVLLPRLSLLYTTDKKLYDKYLVKSFDIIMLFSIPFSIYFFVFSHSIILIMAGKAFTASILTMQILSPLCIVVCLAYFVGFLILYPQHKEKIYTRATVISAVISISLNYFAISYFNQNGAAAVAVIAEILAIVIMFWACRKELLPPKLIDRNFLKIIAVSVLVFCASFLTSFNVVYSVFPFFIYSGLFFTLFFALLLVIKEKNSVSFYSLIKSKISKSNVGI